MVENARKPFVFVLMPFKEEFRDIYEFGIKQACNDAGAFCQRVDEQIFVEDILHRVYDQISKADIIVAEMTGRNPNVFYETGYGHALKKEIILLTQDADDIPFDLNHYPHIVYHGKLSMLKPQLEARIRGLIEQHVLTRPQEENAKSKPDESSMPEQKEVELNARPAKEQAIATEKIVSSMNTIEKLLAESSESPPLQQRTFGELTTFLVSFVLALTVGAMILYLSFVIPTILIQIFYEPARPYLGQAISQMPQTIADFATGLGCVSVSVTILLMVLSRKQIRSVFEKIPRG